MGLRDRAARYRRQIIGDKLENLEELYEGKNPSAIRFDRAENRD